MVGGYIAVRIPSRRLPLYLARTASRTAMEIASLCVGWACAIHPVAVVVIGARHLRRKIRLLRHDRSLQLGGWLARYAPPVATQSGNRTRVPPDRRDYADRRPFPRGLVRDRRPEGGAAVGRVVAGEFCGTGSGQKREGVQRRPRADCGTRPDPVRGIVVDHIDTPPEINYWLLSRVLEQLRFFPNTPPRWIIFRANSRGTALSAWNCDSSARRH